MDRSDACPRVIKEIVFRPPNDSNSRPPGGQQEPGQAPHTGLVQSVVVPDGFDWPTIILPTIGGGRPGVTATSPGGQNRGQGGSPDPRVNSILKRMSGNGFPMRDLNG